MSAPAQAERAARPLLTGRVVDLTHDGRGVVNLPDGPVFLDDVLPGEEVKFRITRKKRRFSIGVVSEIVTRSPDRDEPRCVHFGICGGCRLQHMSPAAQLGIKQSRLVEALKRIGGVEPDRVLDAVTGEPWYYRRRARLSVRWVQKKGRAVVGFRERNASFVTNSAGCPILAKPFAELIEALSRMITELSIRARLPQIELTAGDNVNVLVFRVLDAPSAGDLALLGAFGKQHAVEIWLQPGGPDTAAPLGDSEPLSYRMPDFDVTIGFGPTDFVQVNGAANRRLVQRVVDLLDPGPADSVLDLFAGLGNFTLPLARRAGTVTGVEGDPGLVARAAQNAKRNDLENAFFHSADLFADKIDGEWNAGRYDLVLLDPPRAGARGLVENLARFEARRVVYVSCDPATLARDAGTLVHEQGFRLAGAGIVDMFTHTAHVESIAVFDREAAQ